MNWWKLAQSAMNSPQKWYHGTSKDFDTFDSLKSDPSSAWGPGMYLSPTREDAIGWGRKGGGTPRVLEVPHPTGKVFPADGMIPIADLPALEQLIGDDRYSRKGEPVPGTLIYMSLERKLGDKAKVNAALKSIGYEGLTYAINRGKPMQHLLRFAQSQSPTVVLDLKQGLHTVKIGNATIMYHVFPPGHNAHPEGLVEIASLRVPQKLRGSGQAEAAMRAFTAALDKAGMASSLGASPLDQRTKLQRLVNFYGRHGYQPTGQRVNPLGHPVMARPAKPSQGETTP